jgi:glycosyltransferase involved in cell wall biosynthesis
VVNDETRPRTDYPATPPLISCVLAAPAYAGGMDLALLGFLQQTYPSRELIIALSADDPALRGHLAALGRPEIRLLVGPGCSANALIDLAADAAAGELICRWDGLDLHDPRRLGAQYAVLRQTGAQACLIRRVTLWDPTTRRLAVSPGGRHGQTLLALKAVFPRNGQGDGLDRLFAGARVATCDLAQLLLAPGQGRPGASEVFDGPRYGEGLAALGQSLPVAQRLRALTAAASPGAAKGVGVRIHGHMTAAIGLATAARGAAVALGAAGAALDLVDIPLAETHPEAPPGWHGADGGLADASWIAELVHTNPDALDMAAWTGTRASTPDHPAADVIIGAWVWEILDGPPARWRAWAARFDEIWSPTVFSANAIAAGIDTPVTVMPLAVTPRLGAHSRAALGLPADACIFLTAFDATSNVTRKNPAGAIEAFRRAFPRPSPGARLVVKAKKLSAAQLESLQRVAGDRGDIAIINEAWDGDRMASLMNACDAYVSLHRAEGFGYGLADAMALGKPAIGTAYSGNLDFMSRETALLVPYALTSLRQDDPPFPAGCRWAEPDLDAAAAMMAAVAAQPDQAAALGRRAARWMATHYSSAAVGRRMLDRLALLREAQQRQGLWA